MTDQLGATASRKFTIKIVMAIKIPTQKLAVGRAGVPYSSTLRATGGRTPYTWAIVGGALPDDLAFDAATGRITGTPVAAGSAILTFEVRDPLGGTARKTLTLTVR